MKSKLQKQPLKIITALAAFILATPLPGFAAGGPAQCLVVASQQLGNDGYGDWSGTNITWGPGYPRVTVTVDTDESLVFGNGLARQGVSDFPVILGTEANDNPNFISVYRSDLAMNGILTDDGTMTIRYDFEFATQLVDIMLFDLDQTDVAQVQIFGIASNALPASELELVAEGDLSLFFNNSSRPQSELSTPPSWNSQTGTLTSRVPWNENRSYTVLRPKVPISSVLVSATGTIAAPDPNSVGSFGGVSPRNEESRAMRTGRFSRNWFQSLSARGDALRTRTPPRRTEGHEEKSRTFRLFVPSWWLFSPVCHPSSSPANSSRVENWMVGERFSTVAFSSDGSRILLGSLWGR